MAPGVAGGAGLRAVGRRARAPRLSITRATALTRATACTGRTRRTDQPPQMRACDAVPPRDQLHRVERARA